jgi:serine protease Do
MKKMPFPVPGKIAELLRRSTVQVRGESEAWQGGGSGIALADGRVVTNCHVVTGRQPVIESWDGTTVRARIVKTDRSRDLALLQTESLPTVPAVLCSDPPQSGQPVIAVGNPLGFVGAVSTGMIHRVGSIRGLGLAQWIQSNLRLAPGNSGGPLSDIHGQLVGVNTMIAGPFALAIPAGTVQSFLSANSQPSALGVTVRPVSIRGDKIRFGLILLEVERDSAADRASLLQGDVLVSIDDDPLRSPDDLYKAISRGGTLVLGFLRGDAPRLRRVTVQLSSERVVNAA